MSTGRRPTTWTAALLRAAQRLVQRAAALAPEVPAAALRRHAARRIVAAQAQSLLRARGVAPAGALFTSPRLAAADHVAAAAAIAAVDDEPAPAAAPSLAALGELYPQLLAPAARKRHGAWFTPAALAVPTAARALRPLLATDRELPSVYDPAAGAGAFLVAALRLLAAASGLTPGDVAASRLFGAERDATAASLAAWALHEACGDSAPPIGLLEANVRAGDGLQADAREPFDVVLGNPPWETLQRSRADDADDVDGADADVAAPDRRRALRDRFRHQGRGKLYTYRLFLERALELLRPGGRLGMLLPASLYFDRDAASLRALLLDGCRWEWLFGFENRRQIFAIDTRYRFCAIVAQRGGRTAAVRTAFLQTVPERWAAPRPQHLRYRREDVTALSPASGAFVEVQHERDLELLRRLHGAGRPLLAPDAYRWRQGDHNMTSARGRFRDRRSCERDGYRPTDDGSWRNGEAPPLRALYQGAMIADLHPNAGAYAGGTGRAVRWRRPQAPTRLEPRYLIAVAGGGAGAVPARVALRALSNATNARTAVACLLGDEPCGNSLGVLTPASRTARLLRDSAFLAGVLASLCWDWALRQRLAGTNLNGFVLADTVIPDADSLQRDSIAVLALQLCAVLPWHAPLWRRAAAEGWLPATATPAPANLDAPARLALRAALELEVAQAFALASADLEWILRGCDHPRAQLADPAFTATLDPKGFWRVDRDRSPEQRLPQRVLALVRQRPLVSPAGQPSG